MHTRLAGNMAQREKSNVQVKLQWMHFVLEEATLENEEAMMESYSFLFYK